MSDSSELRGDPRKAMFVAADLVVGTVPVPVKIRNMSVKGALLEAAALPPQGTMVQLVRGPLTIGGTISWVEEGRCGISLAGAVSVEDWIKGKLPDHQAQVDALIAQIRSQGLEPRSLAAAVPPVPSLEQSGTSLVEELRAITALLGALEDALIDDPDVLAKHGAALQNIDEAQQRLAALARRAVS